MRITPPPPGWTPDENLIDSLSSGVIHLWHAPLQVEQSLITDAKMLLSNDEQLRATKFATTKLGHQYIAGRFWLRYLLGKYCESDPSTIKFLQGSNGKPLCSSHGIHFNLSHSGNTAVYGFCRDHAIGVDIEFIRSDVRPLEIANRFFSSDEQIRLAELAEDYQIKAFFECWTRKEAYCKATGLGLQQPLGEFSVSFGEAEECRFRQMKEENWQLHDLPMGECWRGAVAYQGERQQLQYYSIKAPKKLF